MTTKKQEFDYRAISDRIHTDYERTEIARRTAALMIDAYAVIDLLSPPHIDQLSLRVDKLNIE